MTKFLVHDIIWFVDGAMVYYVEDDDDELIIGVYLHKYKYKYKRGWGWWAPYWGQFPQIQIQHEDEDDELLIGVCLHSRLGAAFTYDFLLTRQMQ